MKDAGKFVICQLKKTWSKARIFIAERRSIVRKFETVQKRYRNICRNKKRRGPAQQAQEKLFQSMSKKLFDIAHNQAMELVKIEEDRQFLQDQCKDKNVYE